MKRLHPGNLAAPAALDFDGTNPRTLRNHEIHLLVPATPIGHRTPHRVQMIEKVGAYGIFHQAPPPDAICEGFIERTAGKGVDQGIVPQNEFWAAPPFADGSLGEKLQP